MSMITELIERLKNFANEYAITDTDTMDAIAKTTEEVGNPDICRK